MNRSLLFIVSMLLSCIIFSQASVYDVISLEDCPALEISGEPELYVGDDLFNLINGGAELYHEYGFVEVLSAVILDQEGESLKVEVYDMGSPEAAWGIYSITTTTNSKDLDAGTAGRHGEGFAQFVKGSFMLYIYFENVQQDRLQFISDCIADNIELSFPPPEIMTAAKAGMEDPEKNIYFKGNLGLSAIYNFHYKDIFGYSEGAAATYPDLKVFVLTYTDEKDCTEGYDHAQDFILNSSKYHEQEVMEGSFRAKDRKEQQVVCFLENTYLLLFISSAEMDIMPLKEKILSSMENE